MSCFACYRLPFAQYYTLIEQTEGEPEHFATCTELNRRKGFVVAPFQITARQPILLIRPDKMLTCPVESPVPQTAKIVSTESHREDYTADFSLFHDQLKKDVFRKIVLARSATLLTDQPVNPHQLFLLACQRYPRLFISLVSLPNGDYWLTATPEILLQGVDNQWRTIALAGTMQLKDDQLSFDTPPGEAGIVDLQWSAKNLQEQRFVASYIANTLRQFAIDFQEEGPRTVRAADLVHLRSDFTFMLPHDVLVGDLLQALHPTPAVCGLPKQETFRFITAHEHVSRQYYSGFMGPLGIAHSTHLYVSLRCMQIHGNEHHLYAGGGLLKDSVEQQEWLETEAKMQTMKKIILN